VCAAAETLEPVHEFSRIFQRRPSGAKAQRLCGFYGTAEQAAEKVIKEGTVSAQGSGLDKKHARRRAQAGGDV
jgi:hypothetical protein